MPFPPRSRSLMFSAPPSVPTPAPSFAAASRPRRRALAPAVAWTAPPSTSGRAHARRDDGGRLRVVRVRGDGRCLFRSIARALAHAERRALSEAMEREDADALRKIAHRAMCVDRRKEFERRHVVEGSLAAYCGRMLNPSFFAGEAEMLAIAETMKFPIAVYVRGQNLGKPIMVYGEQFSKGRQPIRVLYDGSAHYDAVVRA